jgi:hypothetical protein
MQRAADDEPPDFAFLRRALLETGIGAVSPYSGFQIPPSTTTTAVPLVPVVPPQGTTDQHSATSTSSQQHPVPRITHPPRVGWYRQLLFELAEPVVLSAEEYMSHWPYISSAYTLNKRLPKQQLERPHRTIGADCGLVIHGKVKEKAKEGRQFVWV